MLGNLNTDQLVIELTEILKQQQKNLIQTKSQLEPWMGKIGED